MAKRVIKATAENGQRKIEIILKVNFKKGEYYTGTIFNHTQRLRNNLYDFISNQSFDNSQIKIK